MSIMRKLGDTNDIIDATGKASVNFHSPDLDANARFALRATFTIRNPNCTQYVIDKFADVLANGTLRDAATNNTHSDADIMTVPS